jgi:hypothetical protein
MPLVGFAVDGVPGECGQRRECGVPVSEEAVMGHRLIVLRFAAMVNSIVAVG